jgi:hypothetical protein
MVSAGIVRNPFTDQSWIMFLNAIGIILSLASLALSGKQIKSSVIRVDVSADVHSVCPFA